jgi:class I fructose-bisphosphate aldolase
MEWAVQSGADMPVVMSGGSKVSDYEFLSSVEAVMDAGGAGLAVGRNVWQRDEPERILDALEQVIFEGATADEALDE